VALKSRLPAVGAAESDMRDNARPVHMKRNRSDFDLVQFNILGGICAEPLNGSYMSA
jgi:hypothetical protein